MQLRCATVTTKGKIMKELLLAGLVVVWASMATAHSPLKSTTPENEAIIAEAPKEIKLNFGNGIHLTRLTVTDATGKKNKLDIRTYPGFTKKYQVPFEAVGVGKYLIEWRGLGADGHALNGNFSFTVE
jgi:methionine-rich copper-binding protein CopC